jgi:hypothetical protein
VKKRLTRQQLVAAAAHLAASTMDKDPAMAEHVALLEGVQDHYELGALQFYRYLDALERLQDGATTREDAPPPPPPHA